MTEQGPRVSPWVWAILLLLLVGVCSVACTPKAPPAVFASPVPTLPVVAHVEGEAFPGDCEIASVHPGEPMPSVVLERVPGNGVEAQATCAGHVVPSGLLAEWAGYETEVAAWQAAAEHQRASAERDRAYCQSAYGQEWQHAEELRRDARALRWVGYGLGAGGLVVGLLVGYGVGSLP